jgi:ribonuclease J
MSFRASMAAELEAIRCLAGGLLVYSMWPGYLERGALDLRDWAARNGMTFEVMHTSGHAGSKDLRRLVRALSPRMLVPIHTLAPERFGQFGCQVWPARDGTWIPV